MGLRTEHLSFEVLVSIVQLEQKNQDDEAELHYSRNRFCSVGFDGGHAHCGSRMTGMAAATAVHRMGLSSGQEAKLHSATQEIIAIVVTTISHKPTLDIVVRHNWRLA